MNDLYQIYLAVKKEGVAQVSHQPSVSYENARWIK